MQIRYDCLAGIKYKKAILKGCKPNSCIAILDRYFSRSRIRHNMLYKRILKHKKNFSLLVHGFWEDSHIFTKNHEKKAIKKAKRLNKIAVKCKRKIYYSPFLEHRLPPRRMAKLFMKIKQEAPMLILVNSYLEKPVNMPYVYDEVHHEGYKEFPSRTYIFSTDGRDALKLNIKAHMNQHKHALMFGLWTPLFNGKTSINDKTPPLKRKHFPDVDFMESFNRQLNL